MMAVATVASAAAALPPAGGAAPVIAANASGALGLYAANAFTLGVGGDGAAPPSRQAAWYFRAETIAVPRTGSPLPSYEPGVHAFDDVRQGSQGFTAGVDFGDFVVWRKDDVPAYELAVVADDIAMRITEVVRGEDLLKSTARQLLLYRALAAEPPSWCHEPLVRDAEGKRLAKRHQALSLRTLRERGVDWREALAAMGVS